MKNWILYISIFFLQLVPLFSQGMGQGDTYLKQQKYPEAISAYEKIAGEGYIGHRLFFNLGTAYLKNHQVGEAMLNFEKASRLKPVDPATMQQLLQLRLQLRDKPSIYQDSGVLLWIKKIRYALPMDGWALISIVCMIGFAACIFLSYKKKRSRYKQVFFTGAFFMFFLSILAFFMASGIYRSSFANEAIVIPETINMYEKPSEATAIIFTLHEGTKVDVLKEENGMILVNYDKEKGWVHKKDIENIRF